MIRWFDHYLKNIDNGVEKDPPVRYYVMGAIGEPGAPGNEWRTATDWPVRATETPYYLHKEGKLNAHRPREPKSSTSSHPRNVQTTSGIRATLQPDDIML